MIMIQRRGGEGSAARFAPGQLIRHVRYGYRGVVVDFDPYCTAPEDWYQSNQTQPVREQPWYHVLVNESVITTYAAETSLDPDPSGEEIQHPLIEAFFNGFEGGRYLRNDRPWGPNPA